MKNMLQITIFCSLLSPLANADRLCDTGMWRLLAQTANENGINWTGGLGDCTEEDKNGQMHYLDNVTQTKAIVLKQPTRIQYMRDDEPLMCAKVVNAALIKTDKLCK